MSSSHYHEVAGKKNARIHSISASTVASKFARFKSSWLKRGGTYCNKRCTKHTWLILTNSSTAFAALVVLHYIRNIPCKKLRHYLNLSKLCPKHCQSLFPGHGVDAVFFDVLADGQLLFHTDNAAVCQSRNTPRFESKTGKTTSSTSSQHNTSFYRTSLGRIIRCC